MHILIAPNAFKHSLNAEAAALAIQKGLLESTLDCTCECFPIGDGGDGTGELILTKCNGTIVDSIVNNPLGKKIKSSFGLINNGRTAIIEIASASGLRLLASEELNPLKAFSFGTGEQIKLALDMGVSKIIICMGGSATVDGGIGILSALGIQFLNGQGKTLSGLPESLIDLVAMNVSTLDLRILDCEVVVLCDVENRLLGEKGAAAVFSPQKGATAKDVRTLNSALERFTEITFKATGKDMSTIKYGGTAGGAAAGLNAVINAKLVSGIDYFLQLTGFDSALAKCKLVITGEGSIDEQTLQGKGPIGVAVRAKLKNLPVIGIAGKVPIQKSDDLGKYFDVLMSIGHEPTDLASALSFTRHNLIRSAREIGNLLSLNTG